MALTIAKVTNADFVDGNKRRRVRTVTFDSSYATAGESLVPSDVNLRAITEAIPHGAFRNTAGTKAVEVSYDYTNNKLLAYWSKGGPTDGLPEVDSTFDLSTYSGRMTFIGF